MDNMMDTILNFGLIFAVVGASAYTAHRLASLVIKLLQPNPVTDYLGTGKKQRGAGQPSFSDRAGAAIASQLPAFASLKTLEGHLRWAQRGGEYEGRTVEQIIFMSALFGGLGILFPLLIPAPVAWGVPLILLVLPFSRLRSAAKKMRVRAEQSVPEMAALMSAEVAAGVSPEEALMQASKMPGPLAGLVREASAQAAYLGIPVFSHEKRKGSLREAFEGSGISALRAFGVQLDVAASKGVDVAQRMSEISSSLAAEYRQRLMRKAEKLDTGMTIAVALFYFVPMMALILVPLLIEAINAI
ncbi:MAG: type II secretion system F family protein [Anaerolineales bacterium]|nr:type II secretion system F family protein [Anaerolineales bacterium]